VNNAPLFHRAMGSAADALRFEFDIDPTHGPEKFATEVRRLIQETTDVQLRVIHSLPPLQPAVLQVMASLNEKYAPFEGATLERYRQAMIENAVEAVETRVGGPAAQQALIALQDKKLVWRATRGAHSVEEQSVVDLLAAGGMLKIAGPA
jgi:hypothetical protein